MSDSKQEQQERLSELMTQAEDLEKTVEHYLEVATALNDKVINNDHRDYTPLDDLPYGEECIELRDVPDDMAAVSKDLIALDLNKMQPQAIEDALDEAEARIQMAQSAVDNCQDLPPSASDDD